MSWFSWKKDPLADVKNQVSDEKKKQNLLESSITRANGIFNDEKENDEDVKLIIQVQKDVAIRVLKLLFSNNIDYRIALNLKECGPLSVNCDRKQLRINLINAIETRVEEAISTIRSENEDAGEEVQDEQEYANDWKLNTKTFYGLVADCITRTGKANSSVFGTTHTAADDYGALRQKASSYSARACDAYKKVLKNYPGANQQSVNDFRCYTFPDSMIGGKNIKGGRSKRSRANRPSPKFPAKDYRGQIMKGNDGRMYMSKPDKNGRCSWRLKK